MILFPELLRRGRALLRKDRLEGEMDDELSFHLACQIEENINAGMNPQQARRAARLSLGGVEQIKEQCRDASGLRLVEDFGRDLKYGARSLGKSPGFMIAVVLTLALGIGANTAVFTLINAVLLRPLSVPEPERLVALYHTSIQNPEVFGTTSYPDYLDYRKKNDVLAGLAAYAHVPVYIRAGERVDAVNAVFVTGNYFQILGTSPLIGRGLQPEDDKPGAHPVVILSYRLWQSRFGANPEVVGRIVKIGGNPFTLVGVAPKGFRGVTLDWGAPPDFWIPLAVQGQATPVLQSYDPLSNRRMDWLLVVGRLKPELSVAQAEAALRSLSDALAQTYPRPNNQRTVTLLPIQSARFWPPRRQATINYLTILMGSVVMLLLIACANVANLLLARYSARQREIGTRLALGATPGRLVRQLLAESLILSVLGMAAGGFVAWWMSSLLFEFRFPLRLEPGLDLRVLGFTLVVSVGCAILFGLAPALRSCSVDVISTMKSGGASPLPGSERSGIGRALIVAQVALSLVLLVGAGLFIRTLQKAYRIDPGYLTSEMAFVTVDLASQGYTDEKGGLFYEQLLERVVALPGVRSATWANNGPLSMGRILRSVRPSRTGEDDWIPAETNIVGTGHMGTLGIPLLKGRDFGVRDTKESPLVAMVNETMARKLWSGSDPIGKAFEVKDRRPVQVIAIVRDVKYHQLWEKPRPYYYLALSQNYSGMMTLALACESRPTASLLGAVKQEIGELDKDVPVGGGGTWQRHMRHVLTSQRMGSTLLAIAGLTALVLATVGVYGVLAYSASRRTHEIGIRVALGADRADVMRLVLRKGLTPILVGIALGLVTGVLLSRVVAHHVVRIEPWDPVPFIAVTFLLAATGMLASYVPARRAARIDPMRALRDE